MPSRRMTRIHPMDQLLRWERIGDGEEPVKFRTGLGPLDRVFAHRRLDLIKVDAEGYMEPWGRIAATKEKAR